MIDKESLSGSFFISACRSTLLILLNIYHNFGRNLYHNAEQHS